MEAEGLQLNEETLEKLREFTNEEMVQEVIKEISELGIQTGSIFTSEKLQKTLIQYLDQALRGKNGKNIAYGQGAIGLLERTIYNKYIDTGKKQSSQDIPLDLIPLFLYAARYYRVNGDIGKARKIFAKIREANLYKNDIASRIMLDEEEAACELAELSENDMPIMPIKQETTIQDLLDFLEKNNVKILDSEQEIFSGKDYVRRPIKRRGGKTIERKYPEDLNAITRLKFICDNFDIENVKIVKEGGFKGSAILQIKGKEISIVETFFEKDEKESYGRATYIVPNDLIGANKLNNSSRTKFKSEHTETVIQVNHGKNYYKNLIDRVHKFELSRSNEIVEEDSIKAEEALEKGEQKTEEIIPEIDIKNIGKLTDEALKVLANSLYERIGMVSEEESKELKGILTTVMIESIARKRVTARGQRKIIAKKRQELEEIKQNNPQKLDNIGG